MKRLLAIIPFLFVAGCLSNIAGRSPVTGKMKILGIPVPFTGGEEHVVVDDKLAVLVEQLDKFTWAGLILVIAGVIWWKVTDGFTGIGKTCAALGGAFIGLALILPQIVAYISLLTMVILIAALSYFVWVKILKKN
jgi:hypothetical protein